MKESSEEEKEKEENAALKIQAVFRGHLAREEVKKMKSGEPQEEKREENEWEDWFYSPAPQKNMKKSSGSINLAVIAVFFLSKGDLM